MIYEIDHFCGAAVHNGIARAAVSKPAPARSPWELLGWAVLEQAVDDLVLFCRFGIVTQEGACLPWPSEVKRRIKWTPKGPRYSWDRIPVTISSCKGPNDHSQLCAWFLSEDAESFCDLIGCRLPAQEIYWKTIENHGGPK